MVDGGNVQLKGRNWMTRRGSRVQPRKAKALATELKP